MSEQVQQVDSFTQAIMEQRNAALNEAAYWRAKTVEAQAQIAKMKAAEPEPNPGMIE